MKVLKTLALVMSWPSNSLIHVPVIVECNCPILQWPIYFNCCFFYFIFSRLLRRGVERNHRLYRSSLPEVFCKKGVLKNFVKLTRKHRCQSLGVWHGCFHVNFAKFLRTPFLPNTSRGCFWLYSSTCPQAATEGVLKNFTKFTLLKNRLWQRCFLWILRNF